MFTSVTLTPKNGPYYKVGFWSGDYNDHIIAYKATSHDAYYVEIGYDYTMEDAGRRSHGGVHLRRPICSLTSEARATTTIVFGIKKTFADRRSEVDQRH